MTITISIPNIVINISNTQTLNLEQMAHTIDELIAEVAKTKTLEDGAKTLISGLRQKVADAIANAGAGTSDAELAAIQAKVDETFAQLAASNSDFAGALTENTGTGSTTPPVVDTPAPTTGTTPPVVDTPAPVDTTPAPADGGTTAPVDVPATPVETPAPVDVPSTPTTPGAPDAGTPAAPTGPVTNPDGSTVI